MTATCAAPRVRRVPPPPGADGAFRAPEPEPCDSCGGDGWEPLAEGVRCLRCDGWGYQPLDGHEIPRTRAYGLRRVSFAPAHPASGHPHRLLIETAAKPTHRTAKSRYDVAEMETDWQGVRAFELKKVGSDRVHHCVLGGAEVRCDCEGDTYQTSGKRNQAAHDAGEETFPTHGCKHLDALAALLNAGWFD